MRDFDPNKATIGDGIFGLPHTPGDARVLLVPVPFDATTSYGTGTADGPNAILEASLQVDLFDIETANPWEAGIAMLDEPLHVRELSETARIDAEAVIAAELGGDAPADLAATLSRVNAACAQVDDWVEKTVTAALAQDKLVGTVGGDHAIALGAIAAHAARYPGMGVLHVDAHADLRHAYEGFERSHASIMDNVMRRVSGVSRIVQVGIRDLCAEERDAIAASEGRIRTWFDAELARERFEGTSFATQVTRMLADLPQDVYVSFDIDGLDPALCPNTGTPVPGGLDFHQANFLLGALARSGRRIVGFDLVEVAPGDEGEWDANVGARMLYKLIGWMLHSQS